MHVHLHQIIYHTWMITTNRWDLRVIAWSLMHRLWHLMSLVHDGSICVEILWLWGEKTLCPHWHSVLFCFSKKHTIMKHLSWSLTENMREQHWLVVILIHWIHLRPSLCFHSSRHEVCLTFFTPETKLRHTPPSPPGAAWESDSVTGCPAVTMTGLAHRWEPWQTRPTGWPLNSKCQLLYPSAADTASDGCRASRLY